jgi:hypothetical protein
MKQTEVEMKSNKSIVDFLKKQVFVLTEITIKYEDEMGKIPLDSVRYTEMSLDHKRFLAMKLAIEDVIVYAAGQRVCDEILRAAYQKFNPKQYVA